MATRNDLLTDISELLLFRAVTCLAFSREWMSAQQARKNYELYEFDRLWFRIQWMKAATPGLLAVSLGHTK